MRLIDQSVSHRLRDGVYTTRHIDVSDKLLKNSALEINIPFEL